MGALLSIAAAVSTLMLAGAMGIHNGAPGLGVADHAAGHGAKRSRDLPRRASADPVRISIRSIGVRARMVRLGLNHQRALQTPRRFSKVGWWKGGPQPGERGPAVLVGHYDSHTGPAVFYRLGRLRRGDPITVRRRDGKLVRFVVQRLAHYSKAHFPTRAVYGSTPHATLRLITCSGSFDWSAGHYRSNTVVYAKYAPRS
jgi:hypothetical protein